MQEANGLVDTLFKESQFDKKLLSITSPSKPNVIVIIWEGLTAKVINGQYEGKPITPNFNSLSKQGVYFSNLFATGDRTDKGLVAVLSGYPSNPQESILKVPLKASKLPMLSKEFQKEITTLHFIMAVKLSSQI